MSSNQVSLNEQFRTLSNPDPGMWDPVPKIVVLVVVFVALLVVGWFFVCSEKLDQLAVAQKSEEDLRVQYEQKKGQAINLDLYRQQRDEMSRSFATLLKQLPNTTEVKELLVEVNQAGLGRGLQFELFKPGNEQKKEFYATLPITVALSGVYHDLGAFAADIAKLPRIVTLNNLDIKPAKIGRRLATGMEVRTFRYLSDDEIAKTAGQGRGGKK